MAKKTNETKSNVNETKSNVNYFLEMKKVALELDKKWNLSYASWAGVWDVIKWLYPNIKKEWHENLNWTLGFVDDFWAFAKVTVSIEPEFWSATTHLPVQDFRNQAIKKDKLTANDINKAYQRATVKAIAELTWLGLYIYKWEDLPEETKEQTQEKKTETINKALEAVGNPQTPVVAAPETKQEQAEWNKDADKIRYEEWEKYLTEAVFSLVEKKWPTDVTIDDIKNIGIDLMNKWRCDNKDKVYVALRDKILMPLINDLNSKQK